MWPWVLRSTDGQQEWPLLHSIRVHSRKDPAAGRDPVVGTGYRIWRWRWRCLAAPTSLWPGVLLMRGLRALKATVLGCRWGAAPTTRYHQDVFYAFSKCLWYILNNFRGYKSYVIKSSLSKYAVVVFSIFSKLCSCRIFSLPAKDPILIASLFPLPPLGQLLRYFLSQPLCLFWAFHIKWHHTICGRHVWRLLLSLGCIRFIRIVAYISLSFLFCGQTTFHCVDIPHACVRLTADGR